MSGHRKFSDLETEMRPERRARIDAIARALSSEFDQQEAIRIVVLSLLRGNPKGVSRQAIMRGVSASDAHSVDSILAFLAERGLVQVDLSARTPGGVYRWTGPATGDDNLTGAGR